MKRFCIEISNQYLQGFVENEKYVKNCRAIQTNLHNESEFSPVIANEKKFFDSTTLKGYLSNLLECIRWNEVNVDEFKILSFEKPTYDEIVKEACRKKVLVETGNFITRNNAQYQVIIADENIFIICECHYDEKEESFVTNYEKPEVYSNLFEVNSLKDLKMVLNCEINQFAENCEDCGFCEKGEL